MIFERSLRATATRARGGLERVLSHALAEHHDRLRAEQRQDIEELKSWLVGYERRTRRDVYTAMERAAAEESAAFGVQHFVDATPFFHPHETLRHAVRSAPLDGMALEFGVASGTTLTIIAENRRSSGIFGFDSFDGLPEHWRWGFDERAFANDVVPDVARAEIIAGLFQDVLPDFLATHPGPIAFLHIDSDLYSSATFVLDQVRGRLVEKSVILFDEFYNYPGWQEHEYRAWTEFVDSSGLEFDYLAMTADDEQVAVQVTKPPSR